MLLLGATTQGFLGFGFGIVAMGLLSLSHGLVHATGVVNVCSIGLVVWMVWALHRHIHWPTLGRLLPWIAVGLVIGLTLLSTLPPGPMIRALGITTIAIAVWNLFLPLPTGETSWVSAAAAGLLSGGLSGAFNTGGPPLVAYLYRQPLSMDALKATTQSVFLAISLLRLPGAFAFDLLESSVWLDALIGTPSVLVGVTTGIALGRRLPTRRFRTVSWVGLALLGVWLTLRPS